MLHVLALKLWLASVGCSDPRDAVLPTTADAISADAGFQEKLKALDDTERASLAKFFIRKVLSGGVPPGTTVRDALADQSAVEQEAARQEAEAKALAAKLDAERAALTATFDATATVALISKRFLKSNWRSGTYQDSIALEVGLQNKSNKDIAGVKGTIVCEDMFGTLVKRIGIAYDGGIPAGAAKRWSGTLDYNQFRDEDQKLASIDMDKMKSHFEFDVIVFNDGTKIEMPNGDGGL